MKMGRFRSMRRKKSWNKKSYVTFNSNENTFSSFSEEYATSSQNDSSEDKAFTYSTGGEYSEGYTFSDEKNEDKILYQITEKLEQPRGSHNSRTIKDSGHSSFSLYGILSAVDRAVDAVVDVIIPVEKTIGHINFPTDSQSPTKSEAETNALSQNQSRFSIRSRSPRSMSPTRSPRSIPPTLRRGPNTVGARRDVKVVNEPRATTSNRKIDSSETAIEEDSTTFSTVSRGNAKNEKVYDLDPIDEKGQRSSPLAATCAWISFKNRKAGNHEGGCDDEPVELQRKRFFAGYTRTDNDNNTLDSSDHFLGEKISIVRVRRNRSRKKRNVSDQKPNVRQNRALSGDKRYIDENGNPAMSKDEPRRGRSLSPWKKKKEAAPKEERDEGEERDDGEEREPLEDENWWDFLPWASPREDEEPTRAEETSTVLQEEPRKKKSFSPRRKKKMNRNIVEEEKREDPADKISTKNVDWWGSYLWKSPEANETELVDTQTSGNDKSKRKGLRKLFSKKSQQPSHKREIRSRKARK